MLHRLGWCEGDRDRRERVRKGRDGRGWPVMAAGAGAGMTTGVGGATKVTARRAGTPMTPVTPLQKLHWQLMCVLISLDTHVSTQMMRQTASCIS